MELLQWSKSRTSYSTMQQIFAFGNLMKLDGLFQVFCGSKVEDYGCPCDGFSNAWYTISTVVIVWFNSL